jgi:hypothetical protein
MAMDLDVIDFWIETIHKDIGLKDYDMTKRVFYYLHDRLYYFTVGLTGIFVYTINETGAGDLAMCEQVFYIQPSYRGNLALVKNYLRKAERIASRNSCNKLAIGGNIGYKDDSYIKLLKRFGFKDNTLVKEIISGQ